jgi:hypothetical protein
LNAGRILHAKHSDHGACGSNAMCVHTRMLQFAGLAVVHAATQVHARRWAVCVRRILKRTMMTRMPASANGIDSILLSECVCVRHVMLLHPSPTSSFHLSFTVFNVIGDANYQL